MQINEWNEDISDTSLQRLLWLGDYLQNDFLQEQSIQNIIMKKLTDKNVLIFLNEAFKKLKVCEQSSDTWYLLLNTTMNYASQNIITIFRNSKPDFEKVNYKILEEIVERSLKNNVLLLNNEDRVTMISILQFARKTEDFISLLTSQRQNLKVKKINYSNHPSISWKLHNLSNIINKETNPFKFNEQFWKLVAKTEENQLTKKKVLRIYLKYEREVNSDQKTSNQQQQQQEEEEFQKIISVYFQLRVNDPEIQKQNEELGFQVRHIVQKNKKQLILCEISGDEKLNQYNSVNNRLEFTVYLNIDNIYTLLLNHLAINYKDFKTNQTLSLIHQDDLVAIGKSWPATLQEAALNFACLYSQNTNICTEPLELFKAINYESISIDSLQNILNKKQVKNKDAENYISYMKDKKAGIVHTEEQQNSNIDNFSSIRESQQRSLLRGHSSSKPGSTQVNTSICSNNTEASRQNNFSQNYLPVNKLDKMKRMNSVTRLPSQQSDANNTSRSYQTNQFTPNKTNSVQNTLIKQETNGTVPVNPNSESRNSNSRLLQKQSNAMTAESMSRQQISQQLNSKPHFSFSGGGFNKYTINNKENNKINNDSSFSSEVPNRNSTTNLNLAMAFNSVGQNNEKLKTLEKPVSGRNNENDQVQPESKFVGSLGEELLKEREIMKKQILTQLNFTQYINKNEQWLQREFVNTNSYI